MSSLFDIEDTIAAILRNLYEKKATEIDAEYLIEQTKQKIMLVYHTAFTDGNDDLLDYLPPVEHAEN
jgi:hypothetical protein